MKSELDRHTDAVVDLIGRVARPGARSVIAIAGPPGSGKSTLAAETVARLNAAAAMSRAALLPMDGFHLDNSVLDERGLRAVKGAPETFDAEGFVRLIRKVRAGGDDIRFPLFDRAEDRTLADAGLLPASTPIVIVEGNYLLLNTGPWAALKPLFDASVMISPPLDVLEERLVARWMSYGLSSEAAARRASGNDIVNARTVIDSSADADIRL
ncbi:uridine kinase [Martelella radicis]|uniref:Pantothenate kinase n=1 Tax=Martelella radicis TaxID=1397476 RepID=A0A7W6KKX1_9HYPH|nr:uridine kinase [Martelella radicis]MBB4123209.1 pantothenate kinase [Martelella radicis]